MDASNIIKRLPAQPTSPWWNDWLKTKVFFSAETPMATENHKAKPKTSAADDAIWELNVLREKVAEIMDRMESVDNDDKQVRKRAGRKGKEHRRKVISL
jgi:hypothetical protein